MDVAIKTTGVGVPSTPVVSLGDETTTLKVPKRAAALLQRVMALGDGIHTLTIVKNRSGAAGIQGWSVSASAKIETVKR